MGRKIFKWLTLAVITVLLGTGVVACQGSAQPQVQTIKVTRGNLVLKVSADGTLALVEDRKLTFDTSGTVSEVNVKEGDFVKKGTVLARLDTTDLQRTVDRAALAVDAAKVDRQQAEDSIKPAEIDLEQATNNYRKITYPYTYSTFAFDVPAAIDAINNARRQIADAQTQLQNPDLTSEQHARLTDQLKQAQDNLTAASERLARGQGPDLFTSQQFPINDYWVLQAAQLQMEKAQTAVDAAQNNLSKAEVALNQANYEYDVAQKEMTKTVISAPFDGVIANSNVKVGDQLTVASYAMTTAFEMIDPSQLELEIKVDEVDIPDVKPGQPVLIDVDAFPDQKFNGTVTSISPLPTVEGGIVSYKVKAALNVPGDSPLKNGMSATADIIRLERPDVLLIPNLAIKQDSQGKPMVEVVVNGQIEERSITVGASDSFQTEVTSGLSEGDTIVESQTAPTTAGSIFG